MIRPVSDARGFPFRVSHYRDSGFIKGFLSLPFFRTVAKYDDSGSNPYSFISRPQGEDFRSGANSRHRSGHRMPGRVFRWIGGYRQDFEVRKRLATSHRCLPYRCRIGYRRKALASLSGRKRRSRGISYPQKSAKKLKGTDHVFPTHQGRKGNQILNPE